MSRARNTTTTPRTEPPTNRWGVSLDRYHGTVSVECPGCDRPADPGLDRWINEGATVGRLVCPDCGEILDLEEVDP